MRTGWQLRPREYCDIGKLPATNLAETLNRIPGVKLNRDIDGEGVQVSIRGLGPSFTKVLLNGTQIGVASDGGTNGGSTNREVDLLRECTLLGLLPGSRGAVGSSRNVLTGGAAAPEATAGIRSGARGLSGCAAAKSARLG